MSDDSSVNVRCALFEALVFSATTLWATATYWTIKSRYPEYRRGTVYAAMALLVTVAAIVILYARRD